MKISEFFTNAGHPYIFEDIRSAYQRLSLTVPPWLVNLDYLSNLYIYARSGDKTVSPLITRTLNGASVTWAQTVIAEDIVVRFAEKWDKLYNNVVLASYQAIENYDLNELETPDITRHKEEETRKSHLRTEQTDITITSSGDSQGKVYGFNSAAASPATASESGASQRTVGQPTSNRVTDEDDGRASDNYTTERESGTRALRRHGNIGVTTSQQMLESEIKLREWEFLQTVFSDIDNLCALKIYDI